MRTVGNVPKHRERTSHPIKRWRSYTRGWRAHHAQLGPPAAEMFSEREKEIPLSMLGVQHVGDAHPLDGLVDRVIIKGRVVVLVASEQ